MRRFLFLAVVFVTGLLDLLTVFSLPAHAQGFCGVSFYSGMDPDVQTDGMCDEFLRENAEAARLSPGFKPIFPIVWGTFGFDETCPARFAELFRDRPHAFEIHFGNGSCRRFQSCAEGEFMGNVSVAEENRALEQMSAATLKETLGRGSDITNFAHRVGNANTTWFLSTTLENNHTAKAEDNLQLALRHVWPYFLVANPIAVRHKGDAEFYETHSPSSRPRVFPCFVNEDGHDESLREEQSFMRRFSRCEARILWPGELQGRPPGGKRIPPRKRKFSMSRTHRHDYPRLLAAFCK
jgi:hypothetical protein